LGETAAETVTKLKEACKKPWVNLKCVSGLIISKELKYMLKANRIVAAIPRAELIKMLKKFTRMSLQIDVGPLTNYLK
jgi:hypothetical protein